MPASFVTSADMARFLPETLLTIFGTLLMVLDGILRKRSSNLFGNLTLLALVAAMGASIYAYTQQGPAFGGMLVVDGFATFFRVLVIAAGILVVLPSYSYLARENAETGEYHALLLFSLVGQCLMAAANDLIIVFIGLEISSIASYVLAGYLRDDKRCNEAALKYFLLGSFATAFFLYGVAIIYGCTGTVKLDQIHAALTGANAPFPVFVALAAALMLVGLGFKVSAAPFQIWAPDVYQGAPTPVSAFLSAGPKAAAFAVFLRIFMTAFEPIGAGWEPLVWGVGAALDDHRQLRRAAAIQRQAHAGLQLDRPRRLRAGGADGALGRRDRGRHVLPGRLYLHERRRVRGGQPSFGQGRALPEDRRFRRPGPEAAIHRRHADHLPALADRRAADRRLLRQVLHLQGRAANRTWCG